MGRKGATNPRGSKPGLSREVYARLFVAYQAKPGAHANAARLAPCSPNTAQKAWEKGLRQPLEARVPIREQLAAGTQPPSLGPGPGLPMPDATGPGLAEGDLDARVARVRYEALLVSDRARAACLTLNEAFERLAPRLLAMADRAEVALGKMLRAPPGDDHEKEALKCLGIVKLGAQIGRAVSLITKSTAEADRALVEALRTPFVVTAKPEGLGSGAGAGAGVDEDGEDGDRTDEDRLAELELEQATRGATLARIRARMAREQGEPPADPPAPPGEGPAPSSPATQPAAGAPPVPLAATQQDNATPSAGHPPGPPGLDAARVLLFDSLAPVVTAQVLEAARVHGLAVDDVVAGVLGRDLAQGLDGGSVTAAVCALDEAVVEAVLVLGERWPR